MAKSSRRVSVASVTLWGKEVGAVAWDSNRQVASFEFARSFLADGFEISPIMLPRKEGIFSFPSLNRETFQGLPGLLADSLPDRFGNALIDLWLTRQGRSKEDFSPVERLCYIATRGMGALEYKPALVRQTSKSEPLEIAELTRLAQQVIGSRAQFTAQLGKDEEAINTIIRVGTSAGGARPKALIAWNPQTYAIRSGQVPPPAGFEPWILKFDGVRDQLLGDSQGYGRIEYAYYHMARAAGIDMMECRLLKEGGRAHFMTRRFDRDQDHEKIHMQSLCAIAHYDFNMAGAYGYEEALDVIQRLNLGHKSLSEMYRRMVFNVFARNQDDHTRNIAFLMGQDGKWRLSPAFDMMWAYNSGGPWTNQHQMSINGKRDNFARMDLLAVAQLFGVKKASDILQEVSDAVKRWPEFAAQSHVPEEQVNRIASTHRLVIA